MISAAFSKSSVQQYGTSALENERERRVGVGWGANIARLSLKIFDIIIYSSAPKEEDVSRHHHEKCSSFSQPCTASDHPPFSPTMETSPAAMEASRELSSVARGRWETDVTQEAAMFLARPFAARTTKEEGFRLFKFANSLVKLGVKKVDRYLLVCVADFVNCLVLSSACIYLSLSLESVCLTSTSLPHDISLPPACHIPFLHLSFSIPFSYISLVYLDLPPNHLKKKNQVNIC